MDEPVAVTKNQVASYLYFCTLYFVTIGVLYLWGYWSTFNVNILEYLSLADVLKATAYPIATALILIVAGTAVGELLLVPSLEAIWGPPKPKSDTFLQVMFLLDLAVIPPLLLFGPIEKWAVLPLLVATPVQVLAARRGFLGKLVPHASTRNIVTFVLAILPPLAYGHGRIDANYVESGSAFTYVLNELPGTTGTNERTPAERLRLLGHAGDNFFLLDPIKDSLIILRIESGEELVFKNFKQPRSKPNVIPNPSKGTTVPGQLGPAD